MFRRLTILTEFFNESSQRILSKNLYNAQFCSVRKRTTSPIKLAYEEFGTGDSGVAPIIILHGLFGSKQNWRSISKTIATESRPKRKVISLDARNHGESPHSDEHTYSSLAEDVKGFLENMNLGKAIILGHSMGGKAMMYLTLKYPQLVDRAIIVDVSPIIEPTRSFSGMRNIFGAMKSITIPPNLSMSEGRRQAKEQLFKSIGDASTVDFIILNLRKSEEKGFYWIVNVNGLENQFSEIIDFPAKELAPRTYKGPVLFIGGSKSYFLNQSHLPGIQKFFPNAKLTFLDAGHLVQLEKPAEFKSLVLDFLNSK